MSNKYCGTCVNYNPNRGPSVPYSCMVIGENVRALSLGCMKYEADPSKTPTGSAQAEENTAGVKQDQDKPRFDLIPPEALFALADILTYGAQKYEPRNWEKGLRWGRVYRAALSHLFQWWAGVPADEETGRSHLWHALCCIVFLVAYEVRGTGEDDRPTDPQKRRDSE